MPRYLFGPVTSSYANQYLNGPIAASDCVAFDHDGPLASRPDDSWETFSARFPAGWQPDFLVLMLQYNVIPDWIWQAPIPIVGLATDWNLQWHYYRHVADRCDHILTDKPGVGVFQREGIQHVSVGNLYGCDPARLTDPPHSVERDIDILFIGNVHPFVQSDRLPWLARIAQLSDRYLVCIEGGVFGEDYRNRLARSRIVFNLSIRGECNMRVVETIAAGALLFQETGNEEVRTMLTDGQECVYYDEHNLEEQLDYYLSHESERAVIAENARRRIGEFTFERFWGEQLVVIHTLAPELAARMRMRLNGSQSAKLMRRVWQRQVAAFGTDEALEADLLRALADDASNATLHHGLGCLCQWGRQRDRAAQGFQKAFACDPRHLVAGASFAQALVRLGQREFAMDQARRVLRMLSQTEAMADLSDLVLAAPVPELEFTPLREAWERAAFENAGNRVEELQTKRAVIFWWMHSLLGEVTGDALHFYEALRACPKMPTTHGLLATCLVRRGQSELAVAHLRIATTALPFETHYASELYTALGNLGDTLGQHRLAVFRSRLQTAAPGLIRPEEWFADLTSQGSATPSQSARRFRIAWHGDQSPLHSLSIVNREICSRLIERGHEVTLIEQDSGREKSSTCPLSPTLSDRLNVPLTGPADIHICHCWPPVMNAPSIGHWVWIQPWEYGSLPVAWFTTAYDLLDEIWAPTRHVQQCFLKAGIPRERVPVIPNGIAAVYFETHPHFPLRTQKRFRFLYCGGTIHRKGFDQLLSAYGQTFRRTDEVCLVIKDMGVKSFYSGQTSQDLIGQFREDPVAPEVEYLDEEFSPEEMSGLYASCDCLVHTYRAEGFAMPIAEAMASGLPVIVTGAGAALDFCSDETAYLISAHIVEGNVNAVGDIATLRPPSWAEIDPDSLRRLLRQVFENLSATSKRAARGAALIREKYNWEQVVDQIEDRLERIAEQPVRRSRSTAVAPIALESGRPTQPATRTSARRRVSLCMIVRDNEDTIEACLASIRPWVDEIIIIDTGSMDRTIEICRRFGAQVYSFPWCDDFSAARNESLKYATGDWIFWMDSDDIMPPDQGRLLRELVDRQHADNCLGYVLQVRCPSRQPGNYTVVDHVKLFRRMPSLRFEHRIHEQIIPSIRRAGGTVEFTKIYVVHAGSNQTSEGRARKLERDLRILELELRERPDHPFVLFNLGMTYEDAGDHSRAEAHLRRCIECSGPGESQLGKAWSLLVNCLRSQGKGEEAVIAVKRALQHFGSDKELLFRYATLLQDVGSHDEAVSIYHRILSEDAEPGFQSTDPSISGYKSHHNMAVSLKKLGRLKEATDHWRMTVSLSPSFAFAWLSLARVLMQLRDFGALDVLVQNLPIVIQNTATDALIRALLFEARGCLSEVQQTLETAWNAFHDPECLDEFARILMDSGNAISAIAVLRTLQSVRPECPSALHNLAQALRLAQRPAEAIPLARRSLELRPDAPQTIRLLKDLLDSHDDPER